MTDVTLKPLPVFKPVVTEAEIDAVTDVLRSGWWGMGARTAAFESQFAQTVGAAHAVGLNSATAALHLALKVAEVEGGEVITTSLTFVSTNHAILYNNATPVFADVESDTLNIDPAEIEARITSRTKAILVVHYGGHPANMQRIGEIALMNGLTVIEDAAHAAGAYYRNRAIGSISPYTAFSFHAVKNIAAGDGGALTVQDADVDARLRRLRWLGIDRDTWARNNGGGYSWEYEVEELGYKCHMNDIAAALAQVQLDRLTETNARRRQIARMYSAGLCDLDWLKLPVERPDVCSAWHLYVVRTRHRDALHQHLREAGIASSVHYQPNHLYKLYAPYTRSLPVVEAVWSELLTLPLYPDMSDADVWRVVERVRAFNGRV